MSNTPSHSFKKLKNRRQRWLSVHLYLGLILGGIMAIVGLTGSILVFWQAIDDWLHPALRLVTSQSAGEQAFTPMAEILASAQQVMPVGANASFAYYPRHDSATYQWFFSVPHGEDADHYLVFVDPYSAKVTGVTLVQAAGDWLPQSFMPFVFQLHYALLLGETGGVILGTIAAAMLISVLTGLIAWWPLTGKWRQALTIKANASRERFNYDLHKTAGCYSAVVLLVLLLSGIEFNLPSQFHGLLNAISSNTDRYAIRSAPSENPHGLSLSEALAIAEKHYPEGRLDWIYNASTADATYTFCKRGVTSVSRFIDRRCLVIDQYNGQILWVQQPTTGTAGDLLIQWLWPLHSGQAFGLTGRIVVCLSGLACPLLFVTGVIRWWQKRRARGLSGKNTR